MEKTVLLLASNSPRRKQLLGLGNWKFDVFVSDVDETPLHGETPKDYVLRLAKDKALKAAQHARIDQIVIGSDTTVVDGDEILGKPVDEADAKRMLGQLRGRTHQVYTGVAVYKVSNSALITELCITDVPMREYSDDEIERYVRSGDPLDKAGAYAIQHTEFKPVESMRGCFASVMGLPLCHVTRALKQVNVPPEADIPSACQSLLKYECPVFNGILN